MFGRRTLTLLGALVIPTTLLVAPIAVLSDAADSATATISGERGSLPPAARKDLVAIFGPQMRKLGLRVTRAALVDARQNRNPSGTHLAIYVEPLGDYTPGDYVDGTVAVTRVFLPSVFARWEKLRSFDVCQEPRTPVDDRAPAPPETQVFATRAGSRMIDWPTVDVATMVAISEREAAAADTPGTAAFTLYFADRLKDTSAYQQAVGTVAGASTPASPTTYGYG